MVASQTGDWLTKAEIAGVTMNWSRQAIDKGGLDGADLRETRQMQVSSLVSLAKSFELLGFHELASNYAQQAVDFDWDGPVAYWGRWAARTKRVKPKSLYPSVQD